MIDDIEDAITLSMQEASMMAEVEAQERRLKWTWDMIENRGRNRDGEQVKRAGHEVSQEQRELAMKQAMMNWDE